MEMEEKKEILNTLNSIIKTIRNESTKPENRAFKRTLSFCADQLDTIHYALTEALCHYN